MVTLLLTSGASNLTGWQLQKNMDLCQHNNWTQFISLQLGHYSQIIFYNQKTRNAFNFSARESNESRI